MVKKMGEVPKRPPIVIPAGVTEIPAERLHLRVRGCVAELIILGADGVHAAAVVTMHADDFAEALGVVNMSAVLAGVTASGRSAPTMN
jgi:hypothetical protein